VLVLLAVLRRDAALVAAERLLVVGFAVLRLADFVLVPRVERTDPLVFFRDAAAFNCFPLSGVWPRPSSRTPRNSPGPPSSAKHSSRAGYGRSNSFCPSDPGFWTSPAICLKSFLRMSLWANRRQCARRKVCACVPYPSGGTAPGSRVLAPNREGFTKLSCFRTPDGRISR